MKFLNVFVIFLALIGSLFASSLEVDYPFSTKTEKGITISLKEVYNAIYQNYTDHYYYVLYPKSKNPKQATVAITDVKTKKSTTISNVEVIPIANWSTYTIVHEDELTEQKARFNLMDVDN